MEEHTEDAKAAEEAARLSVSFHNEIQFLKVNQLHKVKIAVYASLFANLALCVLQRELFPFLNFNRF